MFLTCYPEETRKLVENNNVVPTFNDEYLSVAKKTALIPGEAKSLLNYRHWLPLGAYNAVRNCNVLVPVLDYTNVFWVGRINHRREVSSI